MVDSESDISEHGYGDSDNEFDSEISDQEKSYESDSGDSVWNLGNDDSGVPKTITYKKEDKNMLFLFESTSRQIEKYEKNQPLTEKDMKHLEELKINMKALEVKLTAWSALTLGKLFEGKEVDSESDYTDMSDSDIDSDEEDMDSENSFDDSECNEEILQTLENPIPELKLVSKENKELLSLYKQQFKQIQDYAQNQPLSEKDFSHFQQLNDSLDKTGDKLRENWAVVREMELDGLSKEEYKAECESNQEALEEETDERLNFLQLESIRLGNRLEMASRENGENVHEINENISLTCSLLMGETERWRERSKLKKALYEKLKAEYKQLLSEKMSGIV